MENKMENKMNTTQWIKEISMILETGTYLQKSAAQYDYIVMPLGNNSYSVCEETEPRGFATKIMSEHEIWAMLEARKEREQAVRKAAFARIGYKG